MSQKKLNVTKIKMRQKSKCDKPPKLPTLTKLKNSKFDKTQKLKCDQIEKI